MDLICTFVASETGAVTVDWVVLTAAITSLGFVVVSVVSGGVESLTGEVDNSLVAMDASIGFLDATAASNQN